MHPSRSIQENLVVFCNHTLMGFLDKLWDDTLAGPRPDTGLGKLRKYASFNFRPNSSKESNGYGRACGEESKEDEVRVTRSIMIIKTPRCQSGTPPVSPAGSTPPVSPFSAGRDSFRFRRRSTSDAYEKTTGIGARSSTSPFDV